ncbi:PTS system transporter subunit IID [Streptococcus pneumoniae]|nr:PTS system transporter subunit IID [Streptococcus pneumoniae]
MQSTLTALIDAASVLGVFMMGALVATVINFEISYKLPIGEKMIDFQDILKPNLPTFASSNLYCLYLLVAW